MQDLGTLTGTTGQSAAFAINSAGVVVGESIASDQTEHVVTWTNGVIQDLGGLPNFAFTSGNAINDNGEVAGSGSQTGNDVTNAFSWTSGSGFVELSNLPNGKGAAAFGINKNGTIVGSADVGTLFSTHAVLWTPTAGIQDLGTLTSGGSDIAFAINSRSQIVGTDSGSNGVSSAFLYTHAKLMMNLNSLIRPGSGWQLQSATAINDSGFIAVTGVTHSFQRAVLLTPQ
jgi:probable HAF family extracellular repeat protein